MSLDVIYHQDSTCRPESCLPDNTVCALTDHILNLILIGDIERDLPRASRRRLLNHGAGSEGFKFMVSVNFRANFRAKGPGQGTRERKREAFHDAGEKRGKLEEAEKLDPRGTCQARGRTETSSTVWGGGEETAIQNLRARCWPRVSTSGKTNGAYTEKPRIWGKRQAYIRLRAVYESGSLRSRF